MRADRDDCMVIRIEDARISQHAALRNLDLLSTSESGSVQNDPIADLDNGLGSFSVGRDGGTSTS